MHFLSGFAAISLWQLAIVAAVAFLASLIGGVSGYGTGALMPLVLVPLVGPAPVVPIIAISAFFNNASRLAAFLKYADFRRAAITTVCSVPTCILSAWGYTRLSSAGAALVIAVGWVIRKMQHKGALEYLGELYVETGQIDKARENVAQLKKLCPSGCEELADLEKTIAEAARAN